jgi:hypothetical protein
MYNKTPSFTTPKPKTIVFTGGINEALSNLEIKAGECYDMVNYEEISGEFHGYRSTMGFERIDGTTVTIDNPNNPGDTLDVTWASTVPLVFTDPDDFSQVDDTAREDRRDQIVGPTGVDYLKGAFDYNGDYFVIGYTSSTGDHSLWKMDAATGWASVASFPAISEGAGIDAGYNYQITKGRMQYFPLVANSSTPNDEIVILCNSVSAAVILYKDNTGLYHCTSLIEANSPQYPGATPVLPSDSSILEGYPMSSMIFNQRLHIAFPYGTLFVSHSGDPFAYDPAVTSGGVFWLGGEITDMVVSPSSLTVFQEKGIDIIKVTDATISGFDERKDTFSAVSGAIRGSAARILGRTLFCDERGITYLEAADQYGDFDISNLSRKIQKTYQANKDQIIGAVLDREKSQYIVYFASGSGIVVTCEPDYRGEFSVRGVSLFNLGITLNTVEEVTKESKRLFTTKEDNYLRLQHQSAASFDGNDISSRFTTAFHNYGTPTNNKTFQRLLFELTANKGQVFSMRPSYDYQGLDTPKSILYESDPQGNEPAIWGEGIWGTFVWGGAGAVNQEYSYITGIGVNMAIQFKSTTRHHLPHVVHNAIVLYTLNGTKW